MNILFNYLIINIYIIFIWLGIVSRRTDRLSGVFAFLIIPYPTRRYKNVIVLYWAVFRILVQFRGSGSFFYIVLCIRILILFRGSGSFFIQFHGSGSLFSSVDPDPFFYIVLCIRILIYKVSWIPLFIQFYVSGNLFIKFHESGSILFCPSTQDALSTQIIIPQKQVGRNSDIYVTMVSSTTQVLHKKQLRVFYFINPGPILLQPWSGNI